MRSCETKNNINSAANYFRGEWTQNNGGKVLSAVFHRASTCHNFRVRANLCVRATYIILQLKSSTVAGVTYPMLDYYVNV